MLRLKAGQKADPTAPYCTTHTQYLRKYRVLLLALQQAICCCSHPLRHQPVRKRSLFSFAEALSQKATHTRGTFLAMVFWGPTGAPLCEQCGSKYTARHLELGAGKRGSQRVYMLCNAILGGLRPVHSPDFVPFQTHPSIHPLLP